MSPRPPRTLLEVCVARGGVLKGGRVASFIACWAIASKSVGHEITLDEYRDWWAESERTAFRYQANFRAMFPGLSNPQPLADVLIAAYAEKMAERGVKGLLMQPAPALALAAA